MWYPREEGLQNMPRLAEKLGDLGTIFIFLFMTMLDLCCCSNFSLVVASGGYSLVAVRGFSLGWLLLWSMDSRVCWLQRLWIPGPRAQAQLLWCMALVGASLVAQMVKNLPAVQEAQVQTLGWEDVLEKGMATHSSIVAWRIPWTEEADSNSPWGRKESDTTERLTCLGIVAPRYMGSSWIRGWTHISCTGRWILYQWATREAPGTIFKISFSAQGYMVMCEQSPIVIRREGSGRQSLWWQGPCSPLLSQCNPMPGAQ